MIPHHHHDPDLDKSSGFHNRNEHTSSHKSDNHHHHGADHQEHNHAKDSGKERNSAFPFHNHISPNNDFVYLMINTVSNPVSSFYLFKVVTSFFDPSLTEPPELDFIRFTNKPFLIASFFEPGAIGLRAPPSIA